MSKVDTISLSRRLEAIASRYVEFERSDAEGASRRRSPFDGVFPGKTLWEEVSELDSDPLSGPLLAWIEFLLVRRVLLPEALHEKHLRDTTIHPIAKWNEEFTLRQLTTRMLAGTSPRAEELFEVRFACSRSRGAARLMVLEKEQEVFLRLGDRAPLGQFPFVELAPVLEFASRRVDDAKRTRRSGRSCFEWNENRLARRATMGWPARLSPDTLLDLSNLRDSSRTLRLGAWRSLERLNPASFLVGLRRVGEAFSVARTPRNLPWVCARDPAGFSESRAGFFLQLWPLLPTFASKRMGLNREAARAFRRELLKALGAESERLALSALLVRASSRRERQNLVSEFTGESFGRERELEEWVGSFPLSTNDVSEWTALLAAASDLDLAIQNWDEDFFENPKFISAFVELLGSPSPTELPREIFDRGAAVLESMLEERGD